MLSAHLMASESDGGLYDTRSEGWSKKPLRPNYRRTFSQINSAAELKATLRNGAYAWPGGYPLYFIAADGEALSFDSVRANLREVVGAITHPSRFERGWRVIGCEVNWENPDLTCAHSGERIDSAYAD